MRYKISKLASTKQNLVRYEVRAHSGVGAERVEIRRHFEKRREADEYVDCQLHTDLEAAKKSKAEPSNGLVVKNENPVFRVEYENWLSMRAKDFSPGWKRNCLQYWRELEPLIGKSKISEMTVACNNVEAFLSKNGNSKATVQRKITWIKSVLNFAVGDCSKRILVNPIAKYKVAKPSDTPLEFWSEEEARSFLSFANAKYLDHSPDRWKYFVYRVALNTGMRAGEIWALRPRHLDESASVIRVEDQVDLVSREIRRPKSKKIRAVPLSDDLSDELRVFAEQVKLNLNDFLFTNRGRPVDHNVFARSVFKKDIREWRGRRIKFHALRHTAAHLMLASGISITDLKSILGHQDLETTMRYLRSRGDEAGLAAKKYCLRPELSSQKVLRVVNADFRV